MIDFRLKEINIAGICLKRQKKTTYHASLQQICGAIIDSSCGKCDSIEEIKQLLENALNVLTKHA